MSANQNVLPWYKDRTSSPPFSLAKKIYSNNPATPPFQTIAFFPWTDESFHTLWNGSLFTPDAHPQWRNMISKFSDAIAIGAQHKLYIVFTEKPRSPICVSLPQDNASITPLPTDAIHVAWTIHPQRPLEPLVIFSHFSLLYIYNIERQGISSYLRGHGGAITSIAVHPISTNLFCTTSRDYSTRIYDLMLSPEQSPSNPPWPPGVGPSRAGAPHGLHMTESEGTANGQGRCIIVLMGGRSGGHQAAVLSAAFHPTLPLIATCGVLDRAVKIWFVATTSKDMITREDKPLFSSTKIHRARVLSISWLKHELLLTHSAPAMMKAPTDSDPKLTRIEPSELKVWQWLSIDRFFPPTVQHHHQRILRGCASDYQESTSFKIISSISFPKTDSQYTIPMLQLYQSPSHDPIVLFTYPYSSSISMFNVIHLQPRKPPTFPLDKTDFVTSTQGMLVCDGQSDETGLSISTWTIKMALGSAAQEESELLTCAMGNEGRVIIGVGTGGGVWIWRA